MLNTHKKNTDIFLKDNVTEDINNLGNRDIVNAFHNNPTHIFEKVDPVVPTGSINNHQDNQFQEFNDNGQINHRINNQLHHPEQKMIVDPNIEKLIHSDIQKKSFKSIQQGSGGNYFQSDDYFFKVMDDMMNIYDSRKILLGYFKIKHVIKYLFEDCKISDKFMLSISPLSNQEYQDAKKLINQFFFTANCKSDISIRIDIKMMNYENSPMMKDLMVIIGLKNILDQYIENDMHNDLENIDNTIKMELIYNNYYYHTER